MDLISLIKKPSAFIPLCMSLVAVALPLVYVAVFGVVHESDEGVGAHLFQLLMALQVPAIAFFAIKWLPAAPKQTLLVLALQMAAFIAAWSPVYFLNL